MRSFRRLLVFAFVAISATALWGQQTMFPSVRGTREMVGAANNLEVEAGFRILTEGGNAVDAGVATVLTAAATEESRFGLGGEMPLLVNMAGQPVVAISGVGVAPARATIEYFAHRQPEAWEDPQRMPPIPSEGIRAAITPGVFDGLILALSRYGTMPFAKVAQPAIEAAEGFPLAEEFAHFLEIYQGIMRQWPTSTAYFYPTGVPLKRGDILREPELVATLRALSAVEKKTHGNRQRKLRAVRDLFYKGSLAKRIAQFSEENGGLISYDDLANFNADVEPPKSTTYRGYEIYKPGFWTQGPVMIEALNILEGYDLKAMGHNSPRYLHTLIEAVKLAFADRDRYYGDPKFVKIPEAILLSKDYAAERRKLIDPEHASMESRPGDFAPPVAMRTGPVGAAIVNDTTCVNVVDRNGNGFSATPSGGWLPSVIA
ncbi:MAG: gamma-glutamyltransferase family protein, partial [Pseudomonadota bacterium]